MNDARPLPPALRIVVEAGGPATSLPLGDGAIRIGRGAANDLRLSSCLASQGTHCRIERDGDGHRLVDLETATGTRVNGARVREHRLCAGDLVEIGEVRLRIVAAATLEDAIALAAAAHRGQTDKAGAPYILHPLRVMLHVAGEAERIAAVLHDVVEDTGWTVERLRAAGFVEEVLAAVVALTRRAGESYDDFIARAKADPIARVVKRADLRDNLDLSRLAAPMESDHERAVRYRRALAQLDPAAPATDGSCHCLDDSWRALAFTPLGMDERFGEVSLATCPACCRRWLRYFYENEAFTRSQRFYVGAVSGDDVITVDNARAMLESLPWYFAGGSFFDGNTRKSTGALNLYP